jgi:hypothetical protein
MVLIVGGVPYINFLEIFLRANFFILISLRKCPEQGERKHR